MSVDLTSSATELEPLLVTIEQAGKLLAVCSKTVANMTRRGQLRAIKIGAATRYSLNELRQFVEDHQRSGEAATP